MSTLFGTVMLSRLFMERQSVQQRVKVMRTPAPFWFRRGKSRIKKRLADNTLSNRTAIIATEDSLTDHQSAEKVRELF